MASTAFDSRLETVSGEATDNANLTQINTMDDLVAQATAKYALKDYTAAAELYSRAAELQAEINGEMSSRNADLLYSYGRCLYHVAVSKSDILGSRVVGDKQEESAKTSTSMQGIRQVATNGVGSPFTRIGREDTTSSRKDNKVVQSEDEKGKLFFQFSGDENFDDSEEEDEGNDADGETEEAEDDFSNAYEVLDLARLLLQRNLRERQEHGGERTAVGDAEAIKQLKERLADTHDLLAEISLENEKFPAAVADLKAALKLKQDIFPQHSSLIAEAHFKLSLALEFSSITGERDSNGEVKSGKQAHVDKVLREEAATQMEAAIESCNIRIGREEATIDSGKPLSDTRKAEITRESIDNVREMVKDMEQRLVELRQPPVSISDSTGTSILDGTEPLGGILGSVLGESAEAQTARIEKATKGANDLTNLVKRKKPPTTKPAVNDSASGNGKRKVDFANLVKEGEGKRTRVEDAGGI